MRRPLPRRATTATALLALAAAATAALAWPDPEPRLKGVTLREIAAAPEQYAGHRVVVQGRLARRPAKVPLRDRGAFLLQGGDGDVLYVVPQIPIADVLEIGRALRVEGTVRAPGPSADEIVETPPVTRVDIVTRSGAAAVLEADLVRPR
jgi:hypothetical protein